MLHVNFAKPFGKIEMATNLQILSKFPWFSKLKSERIYLVPKIAISIGVTYMARHFGMDQAQKAVFASWLSQKIFLWHYTRPSPVYISKSKANTELIREKLK